MNITLMETSYEEAFKGFEFLRKMAETAALGGSDAKHSDDMIRAAVPTGLYEHFKSSPKDVKRYAVLGVSREVDSGVYAVVYTALYPPHGGEVASRPLFHLGNGFLVPIDRPEYKGPRFRFLRRFSDKELISYFKLS